MSEDSAERQANSNGWSDGVHGQCSILAAIQPRTGPSRRALNPRQVGQERHLSCGQTVCRQTLTRAHLSDGQRRAYLPPSRDTSSLSHLNSLHLKQPMKVHLPDQQCSTSKQKYIHFKPFARLYLLTFLFASSHYWIADWQHHKRECHSVIQAIQAFSDLMTCHFTFLLISKLFTSSFLNTSPTSFKYNWPYNFFSKLRAQKFIICFC